MKKALLTFMVAASVLSCKKNDCTRDEFLGTWKGTEKCDTDSISQVVITLKEGGSGDKIIINGAEFIDESVKLDGCELEGGTTVLGVGIKIAGSLNNGSLSLSYVNDAGIISYGCDYTLTKQ